MKLNIIKSTTGIAILLSVVAAGCLKDKKFDTGEVQSDHSNGTVPKVIEIKTNAITTTNVNTFTLQGSDADTTVNLVPVNLATNDAASQDIHVTVVQNDQLITDYNNNNGASLVVPPSNLVQILNPGGLVVIPKGQHTGYLQVKTTPNKLIGTQYALGFTIKSIAESGYIISGNAQNGIAILGVKNQYDGIYITQGFFVHPNPALAGSWTYADDVEQPMYTTGATSIEGYPLVVSAGLVGAALDISVNPDNTLNIVLNGTPTPHDPNNKYDPATKTFHVTGGYRGGSRHLEETLKYLKPRP